MTARVIAVCRSSSHTMSKPIEESIKLLAGLGVEGDAHAGKTVKHRSRVARTPDLPNLRQVHLIHAGLFAEVAGSGFAVTPGLMGENITTEGIDLLALPRGARLRLGPDALIEITGLRNPCYQLDGLQMGLMRACLGRDEAGEPIRKAGVMAIVLEGGTVRAGDGIAVTLPDGPHERLKAV
ncbi:MAG: MOSC domain-containing protein [Micropepsaceae bacterium]